MSVAAVPAYLGKDFRNASPGMRFGMYLPVWTDRQDQEKEVNKRASGKSRAAGEISDYLKANGMDRTIAWLQNRQRNPLARLWQKNDFCSKQSWQAICELSQMDRQAIVGLGQRQASIAASLPDCFTLPARSIAPFVTGMGNEHPLENGFSFLWPYGLPYLPGSGVKGVLRQAARELVSGEWGKNAWLDAPGGEVTIDRNKVSLAAMDILLGLESADRQSEHFRGVLSFWDVIPDIKGNKLMVEVMTPHQTHYYRDGQQPHDSGQPTPISFLTVPPGSGFTFHVQCDRLRLARIAPELAKNEQWKKLLESAFEHAFDWLGFGAKTAVGYGTMKKDALQAGILENRDKEMIEATLSDEEKQIHDVKRLFEEASKRNDRNPGGVLNNARVNLLKAAQEWQEVAMRREAAQLIRATVVFLPWSKKKKQEMNMLLKELEQSSCNP